jgi:hypothetical protein
MGKLNVQCFTCTHKEVCKLSDDYKAAIIRLEGVAFSSGENGTVKIRETSWLDMELKCRHNVSVGMEG